MYIAVSNNGHSNIKGLDINEDNVNILHIE